MEILASNQMFSEEPGNEIVARIGPNGVEWRAGRVMDTSAEDEQEIDSDVLVNVRRAHAMKAVQSEQRRLDLILEENEILAEIARKRGPGSLREDIENH